MSDEDRGRKQEDRQVFVRDRRRTGWFRVDNVIVDEYGQKIGTAGLALYTVLCRRASNDDASCHVTLKRLCLDSGIRDPRTLRKHLRVLQEYGLVQVNPVYGQLGQHANEYVILEVPKSPERRPLQKLQGGTRNVRGPLQNSIPAPGTKDAPHKKTLVKKDFLEDEESRLSTREITTIVNRVRDLRSDTGLSVAQLIEGGHIDGEKWSAAIATTVGRGMAKDLK